MRLDLHVHSRYSPDGKADVDGFVGRLASAGLQGFALTDHNSVAGHRALVDLRDRHPELRILAGVEVSALEGHLLAYGIDELPPSERPVEETATWVRDRGGVTVLAHPFRWFHGAGAEVALRASVDALEVVNGHTSRRANVRAAAVLARRTIGGAGGSDAHDLADLGRAYTEFPAEASTEEDLLEALRRGRTVGGGRSPEPVDRFRWSLRSGLLRVGRGFRRI